MVQGARREYARPVVPSWVLALLGALLVLAFIGQARDQAQPSPIAVRLHAAMPRVCGPTWEVRRLGASSYTARTAGMPAQATPTSCAMAIDPSVAVVLVHLSGDSAQVSTSLTRGGRLDLPAGAWWQVPVDRANNTLVVTPDPYGGDLSVTVYTPDQFPTASLH
jgi:hypothetical protein